MEKELARISRMDSEMSYIINMKWSGMLNVSTILNHFFNIDIDYKPEGMIMRKILSDKANERCKNLKYYRNNNIKQLLQQKGTEFWQFKNYWKLRLQFVSFRLGSTDDTLIIQCKFVGEFSTSIWKALDSI